MCFRILVISIGIYFLMTLTPSASSEEVEPATGNSVNTQQTQITTSQSADIERSSHVHHHGPIDPTFKGFWKKKLIWKPRWVKTWQEKKVFVAVWKRMWGPAEIRDWMPLAKPPPGWLHHHHNPVFVKQTPH